LLQGDVIQHIYTAAAHKNPLRRVIPLDLLEAAETVLGYFGFNSTLYGDTIQKKNKKWWYDLRQERRKDIETERTVHDG
jgi:hypothetical protein